MRPDIKPRKPETEFYTEEKCHIIEVSNSADDPDLSIAIARVEPGVTTRWHHLIDTVERYCIQTGKGLVEVGDLPPAEVNEGDVVVIPAQCRQRITNIGDHDLTFLAICTPRFLPENYVDIDEEHERR